MNIIILAPYPPSVSPSQRFRFEHYLPYLEQNGIHCTYSPFVDLETWQLIFKQGSYFNKLKGISLGFIRRFILLFKLSGFDFIYIHREAAPLGPPFFEWVIVKILRKKIIYDFDDNIWVKMSSTANPGASLIKCRWKVRYICRWSYITTAGNDYLVSYAARYCKKALLIPTVVDTEITHNRIKDHLEEPLTIGWTGTFFNFIYFYKITGPIRKLQSRYKFNFLIIADKDPMLEGVQYEFVKWNKATEIDDLMRLHIGIMPLNNTEIEWGKCAFKAIQYMSLGIPAVVSPVGANMSVVTNGETSYWADTEEEWIFCLEKLIVDINERIRMGEAARKRVQAHYSVLATRDLFLNLFKQEDQ